MLFGDQTNGGQTLGSLHLKKFRSYLEVSKHSREKKVGWSNKIYRLLKIYADSMHMSTNVPSFQNI
jgi:hypothetical protein